MDEYIMRCMKDLKNCSSDDEIMQLLNSIYEDGFQDGLEDAQADMIHSAESGD